MKTTPQSSTYIDEQRRNYSLYVLRHRAIPAATDGLKAAGRRTLWTARDGHHYKTATLAGATMPLHPHASPDDAISQLAGPYCNNIPLFKGDGAFGTLLDPKAFGASRYTSVTVSKFTQDVIFRDIEIIPMQGNYDDTLQEPVHFLPLIPVCLLNPTEGLAIGFRSDILPRALDDIINAQLAHLNNKKVPSVITPRFTPINAKATSVEQGEKSVYYYFEGQYEPVDATTVKITRLPYSLAHTTFVSKLDKLLDSGVITDYTDNSRNVIDVLVKFKKGTLRDMSEDEISKTLGLQLRYGEILNVLFFDGQKIWSTTPVDLVKTFTDWRLNWYATRYERLRDLLQIELQKYYDIRSAIKHKIGAIATKVESRSELKLVLAELGIINIDYIADLPVYRFTLEEDQKNEQRILESETQLQIYVNLLSDPEKRRNVYISELETILSNYKKGKYE